MSGVPVSPEVIDWACERAGKTVSQLATRKALKDLPEWRKGTRLPTRRQLEELAAALRLPLGCFYLRKPPREELRVPLMRTDPRTASKRASVDFLETVELMALRQDWMEEYRDEGGWERLPFVGSASPDDDAASVADSIRRTLGLTPGWQAGLRRWVDALRRLTDAAEDAGILVMRSGVVGSNTRRTLDCDEFRGFVLISEVAPLIFINARDYLAAQIFTVAHELAHVWLGREAAFDLRRLLPADEPYERACDAIAAELLVPKAEFHDALESIPAAEWATPEQLIEHIARRFKVSQIVAARRLHELQPHVLSREQFFDFYRNRVRELAPATQPSGGNPYRTLRARLGRSMTEAVATAALTGRGSLLELSRLTGFKIPTLLTFAAKVRSGEG